MSPRQSEGFTLIELLIVVAIIAVLALIALPNLSMAKRRANQARCAANLKTIAYGLYAYRLDLEKFPLADGIAGEQESMGATSVANGPAANGSWDAVPRALVRLRYVSSAECLFCPTYQNRFKGDRLQRFRYAYNNSAADTGGTVGSTNDVDKDSHDIWFARCKWVPVDRSFRPGEKDAIWPHGESEDRENVLFSNSRVELRDGNADFLAAQP